MLLKYHIKYTLLNDEVLINIYKYDSSRLLTHTEFNIKIIDLNNFFYELIKYIDKEREDNDRIIIIFEDYTNVSKIFSQVFLNFFPNSNLFLNRLNNRLKFVNNREKISLIIKNFNLK